MIPDYQTLMRPSLAVLADGQVHPSRDVVEAVANEFNLTEEERQEMIPSGQERTINNRVGWALTYLVQAGLITRPKRAHVQITEAGTEALERFTEINNTILAQYESFREFKSRTRKGTDASLSADGNSQTESNHLTEVHTEATPLDLVEQAVSTNRAAVESEVLSAAMALDPYAFEELVIRLLAAMGYGKSGTLERTSASGDAGVDGIISQDPLGLDRIYVQAKRYATGNTVDRPRIHEFAGALLGKQGDRGVFITTSKFTKGAIEEAERINARIELIDGNRLAELLVAYKVGTQEDITVSLYRLDEDFFESL